MGPQSGKHLPSHQSPPAFGAAFRSSVGRQSMRERQALGLCWTLVSSMPWVGLDRAKASDMHARRLVLLTPRLTGAYQTT